MEIFNLFLEILTAFLYSFLYIWPKVYLHLSTFIEQKMYLLTNIDFKNTSSLPHLVTTGNESTIEEELFPFLLL